MRLRLFVPLGDFFALSVPLGDSFGGSSSPPAEAVFLPVFIAICIVLVGLFLFMALLLAPFIIAVYIWRQINIARKVAASLDEAKTASHTAQSHSLLAQEMAKAAQSQPDLALDYAQAALQASQLANLAADSAQVAANRAYKEATFAISKAVQSEVLQACAAAREAKESAKIAKQSYRATQWQATRTAIKHTISQTAQAPVKAVRSTVDGTKRKEQELIEASMAMCALIAAADGTISDGEKRRVESLIESNDILKLLNSRKLRKAFAKHCKRLSQNKNAGNVEAREAIAKLRGRYAEAFAVIQIGIIVSKADGIFSVWEAKTIREVSQSIDINPGDVGV